MIKIAPSILSSDYSKLGEELKRMQDCGADWIHFDIMDGHFVPNLTIGVAVVESLRKVSDIFFDVHLMISEPLKYVAAFAKAGADIITFHVEAESDVRETISAIESAGCRAALSIKPKTPASEVFEYLDSIDMVLVMTVEPGFGGQSFMPDMMPKVREIRDECNRRGIDIEIQVDGGINEINISEAAKAGANVFVSGNTIFSAKDSKGMIKQLRDNAQKAYIG